MIFDTRVSRFLDELQVPFEAMFHPPAFSATKRAKHLHISGRLVAKCVMLVTPSCHYLAILPATHNVDLAEVERKLGETVTIATEAETTERFSDCERGALAPFGQLYGLTTLLDDSFQPGTLMVFEAQQHSVAIRMRCSDFESLEQPKRFAFAKAQKAMKKGA